MKSTARIYLETAMATDPRVAELVRRHTGFPMPSSGILEEGKKKGVLKEDGEGGGAPAPASGGQSGSSAITTDSLGDYKVYGRGWLRPARDPKKKDQLPEEKQIDPDADLYKEEKEGDDWFWANDSMIEKLADKVAEAISNLGDDDDGSTLEFEFDDDLFFNPEDLEDTPYTMDGVEDAEDEEIDIEDDEEDEDETAPIEEQVAVVNHIVADFESFTNTGDAMQDEFNIGLDRELRKLIQEDVEVNKPELIKSKIAMARNMKKRAGKMVAGRKRKFFRTDSKTIADRVHKGALRMLKNKFAQNKGGDYEDLSLSAKVDVDQMVKKRKNLLSNIESRLMTSYKQKMAMRKKNQTQNPQRKV